MAKHSVCHFEWSSTDLSKTKRFLEGLFGWELKPWGDSYMVFNVPEGPGGGIMLVDEVRPGSSPAIYIEVEQIEPYLARAAELGGDVEKGKTEIPSVGWYAHLLDPDKNVVGLLEPVKK